MNDNKVNPWVSIIAQFGFDAAIELAQLLEKETDPTSADFQALKAKYTGKTAEDFLNEAGGPPPEAPTVVVVVPPTPPA